MFHSNHEPVGGAVPRPVSWQELLETLRTRPGYASLPTWQLILELVAMINQLATELQRTLGLLPTEIRALIALWHTGPATIGDLAHDLHMSSAASSIMCDRLQARGFVERVPHPTDGRRVVVRLTAAAQQTLMDAGLKIAATARIEPRPALIDPIRPAEPT